MRRVMQKVRFSLVFVLSLLVLAGCSTVPDSVQLPENTEGLPYGTVMTKPDSYQGAWVQWGGVIASIENRAEQTMIEMVYYPLRAYGRPIVGNESMGRYRVYVNSFLDPMVYRKGRAMTFSGNLAGVEEGTVGEHKYTYPKVMAKGFHLWDDIKQVDVTTISVWPHPYWGGWHSGWRSWHSWPYRQRVIIRERNSTPYYDDNRPNRGNNHGGNSSGNGGHSGGRHNDNSASNSNKAPASVQTMREQNERVIKSGKNIR